MSSSSSSTHGIEAELLVQAQIDRHNQAPHSNNIEVPSTSGCCKPPTSCGYVYVNETLWNVGAAMVVNDFDCTRWSNDQQQVCYQCYSCKAALLATLKHSWRKVSIINIVILIILVFVYVVACAAFRNNKRMDNDEAYGEARMSKSRPSRFQF